MLLTINDAAEPGSALGEINQSCVWNGEARSCVRTYYCPLEAACALCCTRFVFALRCPWCSARRDLIREAWIKYGPVSNPTPVHIDIDTE